LGVFWVRGSMRLPKPAAKIMAFTMASLGDTNFDFGKGEAPAH